MERNVIDHSSYETDNIIHLFCFYKKYATNKRIIIAAHTYFEAIDLLIEFNLKADEIYDLNEYLKYDIEKDVLFNICEIEKDYEGYPYFISERIFEKLKSHILNYSFANIHNTKALRCKTNEYVSLILSKKIYEDNYEQKNRNICKK